MRTSVRSRRPWRIELVSGRVRDQVGEALERDDVAVVDELGDRLGERDDLGHRFRLPRGLPTQNGNGLVPLWTVIQRELGELVDRGRPAEAAPAAVLDAAERHLRLVADGLVVDMHDARLDPLARARGPSRSLVMSPAESP